MGNGPLPKQKSFGNPPKLKKGLRKARSQPADRKKRIPQRRKYSTSTAEKAHKPHIPAYILKTTKDFSRNKKFFGFPPKLKRNLREARFSLLSKKRSEE